MTDSTPRRAILVAGMHRSGTSATAHAIATLGLALPESPMGSAPGNELGHWGESARVYELQKELEAEAGTAWDDVLPLSDSWLASPSASAWVDRMAEVMKGEYPGHAPFVFKDPRICRQVPFWLAVSEEMGVEPAFLIPVRSPLEVAASLTRRDGSDPARGYLLWLRHNLEVERDTRGVPRAFISYEGLLRDRRQILDAASQRIGLAWPRRDESAYAELDAVLTGDERHHETRPEELEASPEVAGWVKRAYASLLGACEAAGEPDSVALDEVSAGLAEADLAYAPVLADSEKRRRRSERALPAAVEARDGAIAKLAALASERASLDARIADLETESARDARAIEAMRKERKALIVKSREREAELRAETKRVQRRLERSIGYRAKSAWGMLGQRLSQAGRTASQLGSWVLKPSRTRGIRSLREFWVLRSSPLFDRGYYLNRNHDVANAGMNPVLHYIEHGAREGLDPSPKFSTRRYLEERPDVKASGLNPLYHFIRFGQGEGISAPAASPAAASKPAAIAQIQVPRGDTKSVSVVIPTYNRSERVREAIASALGQSVAPAEVIVVDDASTDGTEDALRSAFPNELESGALVIERRDERRGTSAARNAGVRVAKGDLIAYLDSDNTWDDDFLLHMTSALAERDSAATAYAGINFDDGSGRPPRLRFEEYDRELLLERNFVDLNAFVHERRIYHQLGGFDESLRRLVDWDLVLRYTRQYPPVAVPMGLVDYDGGSDADRITTVEDFATNAAAVKRKLAYEGVWSGRTPLRIGYVLWDYPSLSQTFVLDEIRQIRADGHDVNVYFHTEPDRSAEVDFDVPAYQVSGPEELAGLVAEHDRTMLHAHFAYPATTRLAWPAATAARIPFTFTVHAVDVFHSKNIERNRVAEVAADPLCARVFAIGRFHREFLVERGVPAEKISIARPAASLAFAPEAEVERRLERERRVVASVARFVPKKGIADLVRAAAVLGSGVEVRLYGYGPEDEALRALAEELGADGVSFMGALEDREAVARALEEADVFALPCTRDENGDMDGLPTVLGEAMAAGVPVVTTDVAAIPEVVEDEVTGFVVAQDEPEALASKLAEVLAMEPAVLRPLVHAAKARAAETWNTKVTASTLVEAWSEPPLEIVMVTHSRDEPGGAETTAEILRRIYEMTTTHFKLTIVDNDSDPDYRDSLAGALSGRDNASLVLLDRNIHWGPAMNVAFTDGRSEFAIYVCSKEGFVLKPGWEREYIETLRLSHEVAMAGHRISSPAWVDGKAYTEQPWFKGFRNKPFAESHPDRVFAHVQGGLFGLRRSAYERAGGFSSLVAQDAVDVEFSYVLESLGWKLDSVPAIPSVTKKTRPRVSAHLDEHTVAAHPLTLNSAAQATRLVSGDTSFCNLCAWSGASFSANGAGHDLCPSCGSTPLGRLVYRVVAGTDLPFRSLRCVALIEDEALQRELGPMFTFEHAGEGGVERLGDPSDLVITDLAVVPAARTAEALTLVGEGVRRGATAIIGSSRPADGEDEVARAADELAAAGFNASEVNLPSRALRFPRSGLIVVRRTESPDAVAR